MNEIRTYFRCDYGRIALAVKRMRELDFWLEQLVNDGVCYILIGKALGKNSTGGEISRMLFECCLRCH